MNKNEFIAALSKKLTERGISDVGDIVSEYEQHFSFKVRDGFSEEEIARKLGNPEALAEQFDREDAGKKSGGGRRAITVFGLAVADVFVCAFFLTLFLFAVAVGVLAACLLALGVCLVGNLSPYALIPQMPYGCAVVLSVAAFALSVLAAVGACYCYAFLRQLMRVYLRYHRNRLAACAGRAVLPPLAARAQMSPRANRHLRTWALVSLCVFVVFFAAGFIFCSVAAGSLGFWHAWRWFVK